MPQNARECGTCSLCCKLVGIEALSKPPGAWCPNCKPGVGCGIYADRPQECRDFACAWLENQQLGDEWQPIRSKIVLYFIDDGARLIAHVDSGSPNAWRERPYYEQLKAWSRRWFRSGPKVVVRVGERIIAILPDADVDLGRPAKGDSIFIGEVRTPTGPRFVAQRIPAGAAAPEPSN